MNEERNPVIVVAELQAEINRLTARLAEATRIIHGLMNEVRPAWFYMMGREGYECPWCHAMFRHGLTKKAEDHADDCAYPYVAAWLAAQEKA